MNRKMSNNSSSISSKQYLNLMISPTLPFLALSYTIIFFAVLLNAREIQLIAKKMRKATDFEIVLLNLAIADLINSLLLIGVTILVHYHYLDAKFRLKGSLFWVFSTLTFSMTVSVTFVAAIGIERFLAIRVPLQHRLWHTKRKRLIKCIAMTWVIDVILTMSVVLIDYLQRGRRINLLTQSLAYFYAGLLTFSALLIIVLYIWVLHLMLLRSLTLFNFDKKALKINPKLMRKALKKEKSSVLVCALVVVAFFVCNVPIIVDLFQAKLTRSAAIMLKLSAVLNPLIYFFKGYLEKRYAKMKLVSSNDNSEGSKGNDKTGQGSKGTTTEGRKLHMDGVVIENNAATNKETNHVCEKDSRMNTNNQIKTKNGGDTDHLGDLGIQSKEEDNTVL